MKLIDQPKDVLRHFSTWALFAVAAVQGAWLILPDTLRADLPAHTGAWVEYFVLLASAWGLGGKVVQQPGVKP